MSLNKEQGKVVISALSTMLTRCCEKSETFEKTTHRTIFDLASVPPICVKSYIERVLKWCKCSSECVIMTHVYLDRFLEAKSEFVIRTDNVYSLVLTSLLIASKLYDDLGYDNKWYAQVGGIPLVTLNIMEKFFLLSVQWQTQVSQKGFQRYLRFATGGDIANKPINAPDGSVKNGSLENAVGNEIDHHISSSPLARRSWPFWIVTLLEKKIFITTNTDDFQTFEILLYFTFMMACRFYFSMVPSQTVVFIREIINWSLDYNLRDFYNRHPIVTYRFRKLFHDKKFNEGVWHGFNVSVCVRSEFSNQRPDDLIFTRLSSTMSQYKQNYFQFKQNYFH